MWVGLLRTMVDFSSSVQQYFLTPEDYLTDIRRDSKREWRARLGLVIESAFERC